MGEQLDQFVEGWNFVEILGEGAYGEVRLALNQKTQEAVAVKIVNADKLAGNKDNLKKEVCIHKMLQDVHIIRFYGQRTEGENTYIFLEYAPGGELFDKIEPDIGMPPNQACKYFKQLIAGLEFMHNKGVTHRDIKPENLLLDADGNLKITDFGLSTVFRYKEKERKLDRCCGTPPYVAPEVLGKSTYHAQPADIWSCGIVLIAMLAGELPWDEPSEKCKEFVSWANSETLTTPWTKIDTFSLALLKKILHPLPEKRFTITQIKSDKWFTRAQSMKRPSQSPLSESPHNSQMKRHCSSTGETPNSRLNSYAGRMSSSQPLPMMNATIATESLFAGDENESINTSPWYSQPVHTEDMLLSQVACTPGSSQNPMKLLAKRMTRFHVKNISVEELVRKLIDVFNGFKFQSKKSGPKHLKVTSIDRRKTIIIFSVNILDVPNMPTLVDFRRSKGDGIEFKRQFREIKDKMKDFLVY